jgi:transcription initiation factor IIE alpha subunit
MKISYERFGDEELILATDAIIGRDLSELTDQDLEIRITIAQHMFDRLLNEIDRRGLIKFHEGAPVVPYVAAHIEETILTRANH